MKFEDTRLGRWFFHGDGWYKRYRWITRPYLIVRNRLLNWLDTDR